MVRTGSLLKATTILYVCAIALFSNSAFATSRTSAEQAKLDAARELVARYRELRRSCTDQVGENRRLCFHELHAHNEQYRTAKQQLESGKNDPQNVHLVSF